MDAQTRLLARHFDYAMHLYYTRHGIKTVSALRLDLPLALSDWDFINRDDEEGLADQTTKLEHLGFALAMSGIITVGK